MLEFLHCCYSPSGRRKLNLQLISLRKSKKTWGGLGELAPQQMVAVLSFGKVSKSLPSLLWCSSELPHHLELPLHETKLHFLLSVRPFKMLTSADNPPSGACQVAQAAAQACPWAPLPHRTALESANLVNINGSEKSTWQLTIHSSFWDLPWWAV